MAVGLHLHPRTMLNQSADAELHGLLAEWQARHGLTFAEVAVILAGRQQSVLKYVLRAERHPDHPDRKADEA
jgi:hypothetical protein